MTRRLIPFLNKKKRNNFDYYVDSVDGSDSNDGKMITTPFQTIAKLSTVITGGESIALKCGSHFREQLSPLGNFSKIAAYGIGARPILDGSNVISAGSWTKTALLTNVYETPITPEWNGSGKDFVNVWENGVFLIRVADTATCDATPGSYLPSAEGAGTITLYIHPYGSTIPTSDGKTREYTHRKYGLFTRNYSNVTITGIETRKSLHNDGSLVVGKYTTANDCLARYGSAHNILCESGSLLIDCIAEYAYFGTTNYSLFVGNENAPNNEGIIFTRCHALLSTFDSHATGFYGHRNVSGSFGKVVFNECEIQKCNVGFNFDHASEVECNNAICFDTLTPWRFGNTPWTIDGGIITGNAYRIFEILTAATVVAKNLDIDITGIDVLAFYSTAVVDFTLTDSVIKITSPDGICRCVYLDNALSVLNFQRNHFGDGWSNIYFLTNSPTLMSNYNCFDDNTESFRLGANSYSSVSSWQSATGKDLQSTIGGC